MEGLLEGAALGAIAATSTVLAPLLLPTASGVAIIGATFAMAATGGIAGVVPTYGNPGDSVLNAVGSLVMGFDAAFFNAAMEVAIIHLFH